MQPGRDEQPPRSNHLAVDLGEEQFAVPAQRGDPAGLDAPAVAGDLGAARRVELRRRRAVAGEEVVHMVRRAVAWLSRVNHQDRAAGPGQRDRAAQPGRATADHEYVIALVLIALVHRPTISEGRKN